MIEKEKTGLINFQRQRNLELSKEAFSALEARLQMNSKIKFRRFDIEEKEEEEE